MSSKRVFQLQEFTAHAGKVNCLKIGRKSGRVLVTGGDDKLVNMWAIGKTHVIMSLEGHQSPVESVCFDTAEELVVAGSSAGTIKLWDLDKQQVVRTLNGHKSNCVSIDFHPFGEFFASGSLDTDLKIWDIRRSGCIQTYKGHKKAVNVIKFSPDGRWVISGGEDGLVKLWDLTAGKPLYEFKSHSAAITGLEFHPHEFLLATSSIDRTVKFWDLETFEMISSTDPEISPPKALTFTPDGIAVLGAFSDSLKVWGYEPVRCFDNLSVPWKDVRDINITADQLISCAVSQNCVNIWVVNLQKMRPFSKEASIFDPSNARSSLDLNKTSEALKQLNESQFRAVETPQSQPQPLLAPQPQQPSLPPQPTQSKPKRTPIVTQPVKQPKEEEPFHASNNNNGNNAPVPPKTASSGGLNLNAFIPKSGMSNTSESHGGEQVMEEMFHAHVTICGILRSRCTNLRVLRTMWTKGDVREAIETMSRMNDPAVVADILNTVQDKISTLFSLDMCVDALPVVHDLLAGQHQEYVLTALKTTQSLLNSFGPVIKSTLQAPPSSGVDLSREERMEKCNFCQDMFLKMKKKIESLCTQSGKVGQTSRELLGTWQYL